MNFVNKKQITKEGIVRKVRPFFGVQKIVRKVQRDFKFEKENAGILKK